MGEPEDGPQQPCPKCGRMADNDFLRTWKRCARCINDGGKAKVLYIRVDARTHELIGKAATSMFRMSIAEFCREAIIVRAEARLSELIKEERKEKVKRDFIEALLVPKLH